VDYTLRVKVTLEAQLVAVALIEAKEKISRYKRIKTSQNLREVKATERSVCDRNEWTSTWHTDSIKVWPMLKGQGN